MFSWSPHPIALEFRDGTNAEADDPNDSDEFDDWCQTMWIESGEECKAAGFVLLDDPYSEDVYEFEDGELPTRWRPANTMPDWAIRHRRRVVSVSAKRLRDATPDEVVVAGFPPDESPPHDGTRLTSHGRKLCFLEYHETRDNTTPDSWYWQIKTEDASK